jgi:hypothetical protein
MEAYMKKLKLATILFVILISAPLAVSAMSHQGHAAHDHGKAAETDHPGEMKPGDQGSSQAEKVGHKGMSSDGDMMIVGSMVSKGVRGMAHLKDVSATMADMGMKTTHHFMIAFIDEETGEQIEAGTVALKITNPDAKVGDPIPLMGMDGHFGADVTLDMPGEYHFRLGTALADGTKRKYHFHHVVE